MRAQRQLWVEHRYRTRAQPRREAPLEGTFTSPTGRTGTMSGRMRFSRFAVIAGGLHAVGVCTGDLRDADGARIGMASRGVAAPAQLRDGPEGTIAEIGPFEVDLLGLAVEVRGFTVAVRTLLAVATGASGA